MTLPAIGSAGVPAPAVCAFESPRRTILRRGVTIIELLVAMLILALVCVAWLEIIGIQSARKEARRREAVERLAGMMDAFMYVYSAVAPDLSEGDYRLKKNKSMVYFQSTGQVEPMFDEDVSPIGYRLSVVKMNLSANRLNNLPEYSLFKGWKQKLWLIGRLYGAPSKAWLN